MIWYVSALARAFHSAKIQSVELLTAQIIINLDNDASQAEENKKIPTLPQCFTKKIF